MSTRPTPSGAPLETAPEATGGATVLATMRVVGNGARCDRPLFRLVRIRLTTGTVCEEHLVLVEALGSTCLTHGASCLEAGRAAESFLAACEAGRVQGEIDDHHETSL